MYEKITWLFSFRGRLNRAPYWKIFLVLTAISLALELSSAFYSAVWSKLMVVGIFCVMFFIYVSIAVRRLHDRGKSGWWFMPFVLIPAGLDLLVESSLPILAVRPWTDLLAIPLAARWIFLVWGAAEIKFLKGETGRNRFGDDPLADATPASASC